MPDFDIPEDQMQESQGGDGGVNPIWKSAFLMLGTFVLGAAIPLIITRNDVTPEALAAALTPIQKQLNDITAQNGQNSVQISDLKVDIATLTEDLKLNGRTAAATIATR